MGEKNKYLKVTESIFGPNVGKLRETKTNVGKNSKMKRSQKRTFAMLMERPGKVIYPLSTVYRQINDFYSITINKFLDKGYFV